MSGTNYRIELPFKGEPLLLTPGPLTTSRRTKEAMLRDWGSRDSEFIDMTAEIRHRLLQLIEGEGMFECIPLQGSGTFSVESMIGTLVPKDGKALVLANGAYGKRAAAILDRIGRPHRVIDKGDYLPPRASDVSMALGADPSITHVIAIHCETSSGILNPIAELAEATQMAGRYLLIDSMSAFGAIPIDPVTVPFDALVSSSNKCLEGVPGFGFVFANAEALDKSAGNCHSLSLDVHAQLRGFNQDGQWRFTPPTHVVAAFLEALHQHEQEGGIAGRNRRYSRNRDVVVSGMRSLGFETLLSDEWLSPIIVTFFNPADPAFDFRRFYELIGQRGFLIYPGKLTEVDSFRIGCVGHLDEATMHGVCGAVEEALGEMGVTDASPPESALRERELLRAA